MMRAFITIIGLAVFGLASTAMLSIRDVLSDGHPMHAHFVHRNALVEFQHGATLFAGLENLVWSPSVDRPEQTVAFDRRRGCEVRIRLASLVMRCPDSDDEVITQFSVLPDPLIEGMRISRYDVKNPLLSTIPEAIASRTRGYAVYWAMDDGRLRPRWRSAMFGDVLEVDDSVWVGFERTRESERRGFGATAWWYEAGRPMARTPIAIPELHHIDGIGVSDAGLRVHTWFDPLRNSALGHMDLERRTLRRLDTPSAVANNLRRKAVRLGFVFGLLVIVLGRWRRLSDTACVFVLGSALALAAWVGPQLVRLLLGVIDVIPDSG